MRPYILLFMIMSVTVLSIATPIHAGGEIAGTRTGLGWSGDEWVHGIAYSGGKHLVFGTSYSRDNRGDVFIAMCGPGDCKGYFYGEKGTREEAYGGTVYNDKLYVVGAIYGSNAMGLLAVFGIGSGLSMATGLSYSVKGVDVEFYDVAVDGSYIYVVGRLGSYGLLVRMDKNGGVKDALRIALPRLSLELDSIYINDTRIHVVGKAYSGVSSGIYYAVIDKKTLSIKTQRLLNPEHTGYSSLAPIDGRYGKSLWIYGSNVYIVGDASPTSGGDTVALIRINGNYTGLSYSYPSGNIYPQDSAMYKGSIYVAGGIWVSGTERGFVLYATPDLVVADSSEILGAGSLRARGLTVVASESRVDAYVAVDYDTPGTVALAGLSLKSSPLGLIVGSPKASVKSISMKWGGYGGFAANMLSGGGVDGGIVDVRYTPPSLTIAVSVSGPAVSPGFLFTVTMGGAEIARIMVNGSATVPLPGPGMYHVELLNATSGASGYVSYNLTSVVLPNGTVVREKGVDIYVSSPETIVYRFDTTGYAEVSFIVVHAISGQPLGVSASASFIGGGRNISVASGGKAMLPCGVYEIRVPEHVDGYRLSGVYVNNVMILPRNGRYTVSLTVPGEYTVTAEYAAAETSGAVGGEGEGGEPGMFFLAVTIAIVAVFAALIYLVLRRRG